MTLTQKILQNKKLNGFFNILASNDEIKQALATQLVSLVDLNRVNEIGPSIKSAEDVESHSIELMTLFRDKLYEDNSVIENEKKLRIDSYIEVQKASKGVSVDQIKAKLSSFVNETFPPEDKEAIKAREKRLAQLNIDFDKLKQDLANFSNEGEMRSFLSRRGERLRNLINGNYPTNSEFSK